MNKLKWAIVVLENYKLALVPLLPATKKAYDKCKKTYKDNREKLDKRKGQLNKQLDDTLNDLLKALDELEDL